MNFINYQSKFNIKNQHPILSWKILLINPITYQTFILSTTIRIHLNHLITEFILSTNFILREKENS